MNKSTTLRAEEARRQAQAALQQARQQQAEALQERAMTFESETRKVVGLRAQRLAKATADKSADTAANGVAKLKVS
jgi:hypothetical protein